MAADSRMFARIRLGSMPFALQRRLLTRRETDGANLVVGWPVAAAKGQNNVAEKQYSYASTPQITVELRITVELHSMLA